MIRVINAICLVTPIIFLLCLYLYVIINNYKKSLSDTFLDYINYEMSLNNSDIGFMILLSAVILIIFVIINIICCIFSYNYQIIRHYTSSEFIITSLCIVIIGPLSIVLKYGIYTIFLSFKSRKLNKEITLLDERINAINKIKLVKDTEMQEIALEKLKSKKEKKVKELVYINTIYTLDFVERNEIKEKLFKQS